MLLSAFFNHTCQIPPQGAMTVATVDSSVLLNPDQKYPSTLTSIYIATQKILCINFECYWSYCYIDVRSAAQQLCTVEPYPVISPTHTSIHRYASFCNALFSRTQSIPRKFMIRPLLQHKLQPYQIAASANHMHQQTPLYSQVMFAVLHVLLNTSPLNNTLSIDIIFIHVYTYPYIQLHPCEYLPLQNSNIKSHLHLPLQKIYTYRSLIYTYLCKTFTHIDMKLHFPMSMRNWMLPCFPDNYRRERDFDEREYYAELRQEWDFRMNESNTLHDDLVRLGVPFVDCISLTLPRRNMHQYERAVTKKKKKKRTIL